MEKYNREELKNRLMAIRMSVKKLEKERDEFYKISNPENTSVDMATERRFISDRVSQLYEAERLCKLELSVADLQEKIK